MRCRKAREMLALYAGGDLPERLIPRLMAHIERCPGCAAALKQMQGVLETTGMIAAGDMPGPLPADFEERVMFAVDEKRVDSPMVPERGMRRKLLRPALAFGAAAVTAVVIFAVLRDMGNDTVLVDSETGRYVPGGVAGSRSDVSWDELEARLSGCIEGPYRLASYEPPPKSGVCVVMHKPDPEGEPDRYVIDYCGEGSRLSSLSNYPWFGQRSRRLEVRAGSKENLYIAVCLMPGRGRQERRALRNGLVDEYDPFLNRRGGV